MTDSKPECRVEEDTAGWGNWPRLTCHTHNVTLLRKPFHTAPQWELRRKEFVAEHGEPS